MAEPFSRETQDLLDAADRAIAQSRALVEERRQLIARIEVLAWQAARFRRKKET